MSAALPLVSFTVPAYNHAAYIRECLDKIVEEPYPAKELVVIDDGSTDRTAETVREWIASTPVGFPVKFFSRPNRGLACTLNELVGHSSGRYMRSCSSDDYLIPGTLAGMVELLERRPDKRLAFGDAIVIDEQGRKIKDSVIVDIYRGRKANYATDAGLRREVIRRWALAGPVQLIRLDLYREIGGYDEALRIEDWDMMLRVVARNYAIFIDRPVAAYRLHGLNSIDKHRADSLRTEREYLTVLEKNHRLFRGPGRNRLEYMLHRHRAFLQHLEQGRAPSGPEMKRIRRQAVGQVLQSQLRRIFHGD